MVLCSSQTHRVPFVVSCVVMLLFFASSFHPRHRLFAFCGKLYTSLQMHVAGLFVVFACSLSFGSGFYRRSVSLANLKLFIARRGIDYAWFY